MTSFWLLEEAACGCFARLHRARPCCMQNEVQFFISEFNEQQTSRLYRRFRVVVSRAVCLSSRECNFLVVEQAAFGTLGAARRLALATCSFLGAVSAQRLALLQAFCRIRDSLVRPVSHSFSCSSLLLLSVCSTCRQQLDSLGQKLSSGQL